MEVFFIVVLLVLVLWLFVRTRGRGRQRAEITSLTDQVARLTQRLAWLEHSISAAPPTGTQPIPGPQPAPPVIPFAPPPISQSPVAPFPVAPFPVAPFPVAPVPVAQPQRLAPFLASAPQPPPGPATPRADATRPVAAPFSPGDQAPPTPTPPAAAPPTRSISIEERLGQNWLNKLGIIALVIGLALFLGRELHNLGPLGKSLIGLVLALGLLAGGIFLQRRPTYRIFARAAIGGGWALTFFVTFALYHVDAMQILHSQAVDLVLMLLVASAMVAHSLRYNSQVVTALAFLLAFVTVGISQVTLFSLVAGALLAAGLLFVAARKYWFELAFCGLIGVYLNHFLWLHRVLPNGGVPGHPFPEFTASAALLLLYWLLFRLFYVLRVPPNRRQEVVASLAAILNSVGLLSLLKFQSSHPEWAFYGLLALGAAELALAVFARPRFRTAFIVLSSIASMLLLAAIPFRFSGSNWSLLWLLEAEILFLTGIRMPEIVFRRLGILAGFAAAAQLFFSGAAPILILRQSHPDPSHHLPITIALLAAAILFWFNAELAPRRSPAQLTEDDFDRGTLLATSYLALPAAALGLWVVLPGPWTIVAWLALTLVLAVCSDKLPSKSLATQSDLFALATLIRIFAINLPLSDRFGALTLRVLTVGLAAAMLYLAMRRRTRSWLLPERAIAPFYSWTASSLVAILLWYELQPVSVSVAWVVFGLILFELALTLRRNYLRPQAYALLAAGFVRIFFVNLTISPGQHVFGPRLYTVLPLIAAWFWTYHRLQAELAATKDDTSVSQGTFDRFATPLFAWFGTTAAAALLYVDLRPAAVIYAWAAMAFTLLAIALWLGRRLFTLQSFALLAATVARAVTVFLAPAPLATTFFTSRTFTIGATCAILFLTLPIAFRIRRSNLTLLDSARPWKRYTLLRPEQPFFFVPLALLTVLLALELHTGAITIGWSALGVLAFLFALTVGERSYRLAGLFLLLLGVAKILFWDIWHAPPTERYITLIVMGAALLLVSFLYSRYREKILKLL